MNAWGRRGLAVGASAALALTCGAWGAAQTTPPTATSQTSPQSAPAQQTAPSPQSVPSPQTTSGTQTAPAAGTSGTAQQPAHRTLQLVKAQAQLDKTIDAKKAKQGDPVTAKLVTDVTGQDAQPLPKNTVLEGHVDQVTPSDHKSDSTVVVTFDKAKLKDGQEVPIKATILAMAEPAPLVPSDAGGGASPAGAGAPGGGGAPSGGGGGMSSGARSGGGGGGGESSGPAPQQTPSAGDSGGGGSQPQQMSKVPDVNVTSDIHQHNSATLTSKGKNVKVPDGTQMVLAIAIVPAGTKLE
jgi:hypothetical protein